MVKAALPGDKLRWRRNEYRRLTKAEISQIAGVVYQNTYNLPVSLPSHIRTAVLAQNQAKQVRALKNQGF